MIPKDIIYEISYYFDFLTKNKLKQINKTAYQVVRIMYIPKKYGLLTNFIIKKYPEIKFYPAEYYPEFYPEYYQINITDKQICDMIDKIMCYIHEDVSWMSVFPVELSEKLYRNDEFWHIRDMRDIELLGIDYNIIKIKFDFMIEEIKMKQPINMGELVENLNGIKRYVHRYYGNNLKYWPDLTKYKKREEKLIIKPGFDYKSIVEMINYFKR